VIALAFCCLGLLPLQETAGWRPEQVVSFKPLRKRVGDLAEDLAIAGYDRASGRCREILRGLGSDGKETAALAQRLARATAKAAPLTGSKADQKRAAQLREDSIALAAELLLLAEGLEENQAAALARFALTLDAGQAGARSILGHRRGMDGRWSDPESVATRDRRRAFHLAVLQARDLEIAIEPAEPKDPILLALDGPPAVAVRFGPMRFEGRVPREYLERRLRHALRGSALSRWLILGQLTPVVSEGVAIFVEPGDHQRDYLARAVAMGKYQPASMDQDLTSAVNYAAVSHLASKTAGAALCNPTALDHWIYAFVDHSFLTGTSYPDVRRAEVGEVPPLPSWMLEAHRILVASALYGDSDISARPIPAGSPADWSARDDAERFHLWSGWPGLLNWSETLLERGVQPGIFPIQAVRGYDLPQPHLTHAAAMLHHLYERRGSAEIWRAAALAAKGTKAQTGRWSQETLKAFLGCEPPVFDSAWKAAMLAGDSPIAEGPCVLEMISAARGGGGEDATGILDAVQRAFAGWGGVPPVLDADLSRGCKEHASWLAGHRERLSRWATSRSVDAASEGVSADGAWAALNGVVLDLEGNDDPAAVVDRLLGSLLHRAALQQPWISRIGGGVADEILVLDLLSWGCDWADSETYYPRALQTGVPRRHSSGVESPVPGITAHELGYPITLYTIAMGGDLPAIMELRDEAGNAVEVQAFFPDDFLDFGLSRRGFYAMVPKEPLRAGQHYQVKFRFPVRTVEWTFQTGL